MHPILVQLTNAFNIQLLRERALLLRGLGERAQALSVEAHLINVAKAKVRGRARKAGCEGGSKSGHKANS